jgi:high-affinity iron transporter
MLGAALIVLRESLEAALIVAIVMGATRGVAGRGRWVAMGIAAGITGAVLVAIFAGQLAGAMQGRGQELFNAGILIAAVIMLAWHNTWMSAHGREIAARMKSVGKDVSIGARPLSALAFVTFFAVLREGAETVLFLYGLATSDAGWTGLAGGGVLGLGGGIAAGWLLYRGLLAIPLGKFLSVVGWLILLLAAGLAANAALYLNSAGVLPALVPEMWNSSHLLDQKGVIGTLLHILIGYNDRPMGIQVVFYVATLAIILVLMRLARAGGHNSRARAGETE